MNLFFTAHSNAISKILCIFALKITSYINQMQNAAATSRPADM